MSDDVLQRYDEMIEHALARILVGPIGPLSHLHAFLPEASDTTFPKLKLFRNTVGGAKTCQGNGRRGPHQHELERLLRYCNIRTVMLGCL